MFDHSSETLDRQRRKQPPTDLVSELLLGMRLNGLKYRRMQLAAPFGVRFGADAGRAQFHFVACGAVYLRSTDGATQAFGAGDAILLPRGGAHDLVSAPDLPSRDVSTFEATVLCEAVTGISACPEKTGRTSDALVFSGCMEFDLGGMQPLVALMPEVMRVDTLLDR